MLRWCFSNVAVKENEGGLRKPIKTNRHLKIDGVVATCMAVGRAIAQEEDDTGAYTDEADRPMIQLLRRFLNRAAALRPLRTIYNPLSRVRVRHDVALTYTAFWCAHRIITETAGQVDWELLQVDRDGTRTIRPDLPLARLLAFAPNDEMSSQTFVETLTGHAVTHGNGYAEIVPMQGGGPAALYPLAPDRMHVDRDEANQLNYIYTDGNGDRIPFPQERIFHLKGIGYDGTVGYDVVTANSLSLSTGLQADGYAHKFFANGMHSDGALVSPHKLGSDSLEQIKQEWGNRSGIQNAFEPLVLGNDLKWVPFSMNPEAAQLIEARKFGVSDVARITRIPPHMLGDLERATFSNIEEQALDFACYTMAPWFRRWEQEAWRKLLTPAQKARGFRTKFKAKDLIKGDLKSRAEAYQIARHGGWMNANDIRQEMDLNPVDGPAGSEFIVPLNFQNAKFLNEKPERTDKALPAPDRDEDEPIARAALVQIMERAEQRCTNSVTRKAKHGDVNQLVAQWFASPRNLDQICGEVRPVAHALGQDLGVGHTQLVETINYWIDDVAGAYMGGVPEESQADILAHQLITAIVALGGHRNAA